MVSAVAGIALTLSVALTAIAFIAIPVLVTTLGIASDSTTKSGVTLLQSGNVSWDLLNGNQLLDSLTCSYALFSNATLTLNAPPRSLVVSVPTLSKDLQLSLHDFEPALEELISLGWFGYVVPLSKSNRAVLKVKGPCFDDGSCNLVAWPSGGSNLGVNSMRFFVEKRVTFTYSAGIELFLHKINDTVQEWTSNYTIGLVEGSALRLSLWIL